MYVYDYTNEKWQLYSKYSDLNIVIVVEKGYINIQAKSPAMYRVYEEGKERVNTETIQGYRYKATDKQGTLVTLDFLTSKDPESELVVFSIINKVDGVNLRYYAYPMKND